MKLVSSESEVTALAALCSRNVVVAGTVLAGVDDSYFYNSWTRETFKRIEQINKRTGNLPRWRELLEDPKIKDTTRQKLRKSEVSPVKSVPEARRLLGGLNKYRQLRGMFEMAETTVSKLNQSAVDPDEMLDEIAKTVVALRRNKSESSEVITFGKGNNSTEIVKRLLDPEQANYLPTGFSAFDDENCGIGFGNLFTIGGTSGGGKSTVAMQLAVNWMNMGEDVTMVPLEMSEDEMTARLMANAAGLDVRKILFRRLSKGERVKYIKAYKKFVRRAKTAGGSFRLFKPKQDMTIEEIMASIYPFGSRVVIIDYISLLKGVDGDDAWQKLGAVARYCKVFAENNNMIVVLLCQVNEEGKIRYAQAIKEHSSYCWVFVANQATRENEILNVEQLKARNGRFFDFTLKTEMAFMRVRDMDTGEREKLQSKMNTSKKGKSSGVPSDKSKSETAAANPTPSYLKDLAEEV